MRIELVLDTVRAWNLPVPSYLMMTSSGCEPSGDPLKPRVFYAAPPPPPAAPVRVGGNIKPPIKTKDQRPVYPPIAQSALVEGVVVVEATIGPDGNVLDARVLRSIPLLDSSALDAVRQWEFTPTVVDGRAISVIMTLTVPFNLPNQSLR